MSLESWMDGLLKDADRRERLAELTGIPYTPAEFVPQEIPESAILNIFRVGLEESIKKESRNYQDKLK